MNHLLKSSGSIMKTISVIFATKKIRRTRD